ncbi:maltose o-acetyltransferase [Stemphylium lycopersici]|uniref:Maltose o-acetyltransferase n=1 Tax=Stemphylium lycopersici TaxID=183478 RepID=A0A364MTD2_STELY|nr:maltose o-acetyltransferase [Stemphylium lycopersici]
MSTVLYMPAFNTAPHGPAFTSVNGRSSLSPTDEQRPPVVAKSSTWSPPARDQDTSNHSPRSDSSASTVSSGDRSPENANKRRRSTSVEESVARRSPDEAVASSRRLPHPYQPVNRDTLSAMEAPQQRSLPPLGRLDVERRWQTEPRELPHTGHQHHVEHLERRPTEPVRSSLGSIVELEQDDTSATEVTRAGVQVELKKRKRQFANRTKTGCGTCRRRKKKCDEAKPECNNCTRGGFVCEGYANKVPWPKNGAAKAPPALQAKERLSAIPTCSGCSQPHIPHCPPRTTEASYPPSEIRSAGGLDRKPWNNWPEPTSAPPPPVRAPYPPEAPPPASVPYTQPGTNQHERHLSHEHQAPLPPQQPLHQHNHHAYHHTPHSMSHISTSSPAPAPVVATNPVVQHHVAQQHPRPPPPPPPPTTMPSSRSPTHFTPTSSIMYKSEKDKMLAGEPFLPFDRILMDERHASTGAQQNFNSTAYASNQLSKQTRENLFRTIVAARWVRPRKDTPDIISHLGRNVFVAAPFTCDYGYHLNIADDVVIGSDCHLHDSARICIGKNTKIGVRVTIQTLKTPTDNKSLKGSNGTEVAHEVHIGKNVYIGDNCVIEAGVKIGENTIVRPGSVVSHTLPPNCVAQGNPANILPN